MVVPIDRVGGSMLAPQWSTPEELELDEVPGDPARAALMAVPLHWLAVPWGLPPKLELFSDWQPARVSKETHSELAPGSFQRTPGGLTETSPEGFVEDPLGCEVTETSLRSRESRAL